MVTIRNIKTILTAPRGVDLAVVKVETSEPGLYGLGCATFTQRYRAVASAVEDYLKPLLEGRCVEEIEDIWQTAMGSSYWRNGPVLNNAVSGVDEALWDIKGKMANMPLYNLLGGKCRTGVAYYRHVFGRDMEEAVEGVRRYVEQGCRYIRCQLGLYGGTLRDETGRLAGPGKNAPENSPFGVYYDPARYCRETVELFQRLRQEFGWEVEFLHDVHERLTPIEAISFAKSLEPYWLFFLEDLLPPEQSAWLERLRGQTAAPIAMGELFNNPAEWTGLITGRLIDYIRVHVSQIGGITPAKKLASLCEAFGVRTAWHGPNDLSPVGAAAQIHLDAAIPNFGIQEFAGFTEEEQEVFPGCPEARNGYLYLSGRPGLGVDIDEEKAAKYPCSFREHSWLLARRPDGTAVRP